MDLQIRPTAIMRCASCETADMFDLEDDGLMEQTELRRLRTQPKNHRCGKTDLDWN